MKDVPSKAPRDDAAPSGASPSSPRTGPATVRAVRPDGVRLAFDGDDAPRHAANAAHGYAPRDGDRVLAMVDDAGAAWVIGVLSAPRPASLVDEVLALEERQEEASADAPRRILDKRGRLLFEYDPATDRAVLHAPSGDLELSVPEGALSLRARDGVEVESDGHVRLRGGRHLELEASRDVGPASRVRLQPGELSLVSAVMTAAADRAELLATRVGVKATLLESHLDRARHVAKVVDVRAGRIVERARDVYREVEGLSQTRAGRLKLVAKKAAQLVGENTLLKARDRMKVKGERIHLA